jgi:hypothetical protein
VEKVHKGAKVGIQVYLPVNVELPDVREGQNSELFHEAGLTARTLMFGTELNLERAWSGYRGGDKGEVFPTRRENYLEQL